MHQDILYKGLANIFKNMESLGGVLYLYPEYLIHKPHYMNIQKGETLIHLKNIKEVRKSNNMLIIPNGLLVITHDNSNYRFAVYQKHKWIKEINQAIQLLTGVK